ncbi:hypothetical protein [Verrucomicrobium sp. BvORR034]|uniref:anti-sigma factor family protein n=1 Tax=Verrucomicrobium sp. BvORR034 TaxID=1396418 RepID=UPI0006794853|nr:hypothetical protein [Verrucomicrobium sp. BvORR034]
MKTPDDQLLARWLDGELSADERPRFEAMLEADPALREEASSLRQLGDLLRANVDMERPLPNADFFNSQIQEQIAADQRADQRVKSTAAAGSGSSWLSWLRSPWIFAGAAATLAVGMLVMPSAQPGEETRVLSFYTPKSGIEASTYHNKDAGATVLVLNGLEAIPSDRDIVGINVHHSETDAQVATTTLYDDQGGVLLVMAKDSASKPMVLGRSAH